MTNPIYRNFSPGAADARSSWEQFLTKPYLYPRDAEFSSLIRDVSVGLQEFCQTDANVLLLSTAGTGAVECAIAALPGDTKAVVVRNGYFGERLFEVARYHLRNVSAFELPFGEPFSIIHSDKFVEFANKQNADVLICTHLETSSGVLNDIALFGDVGKSLKATTIVDGISSIGSVECRLKDWGINCFIASTYKSLLCPPGLSFIVADSRFVAKAHRKWSYFFDMERLISVSMKSQYLWSPNLLALHCLTQVLNDINKEGQDEYFGKLQEKALNFRNKISQGDLKIFGNPAFLSPCFTILQLADNNASNWLSFLKENYGIVIGKGLGNDPEKYLRIGHYPNIAAEDFDFLADALLTVYRELKGNIRA